MTSIRETIFFIGFAVVLLVASVLGFIYLVPWAQEHHADTLSAAAQTAVNVGLVIGSVVAVAFVAGITWLVVVGVADAKRHDRERKEANHRFANESTADRLIIARYNLAGERFTDLNVPLDRQLWLVPTDDVTAFNSYRVVTGQFAALIDHAPLYDKTEGESFDEATASPTIVFEHERLWTQWTRFGGEDVLNGRVAAIRDAFRPLIASGAVIAHVDIDTWNPQIPADAKFRTHWRRTAPAVAGAA